MKIGIDISQIVYRGSGVARFTEGLTRAICEYDSGNEWHFFFSSLRRRLPADIGNMIRHRGFKLHTKNLPPTALSALWNHAHIIDIQNFTGRLDWFITSDWTEPPATCKKATVIHDLAFRRYPETVTSSIRRTQEKRLKWVSKESKIIFADSASTKHDIIDYLHIPSHQIKVVYPGVDAPSQTARDLPPSDNGEKYILTVGKREPRKNLDRLIEAYSKLAPKGIELVIVGERGWGETPKPADSPASIRFLGYVSDDELAALYKNCLFFIYPSLWEGFGYPIIEAMAYGAPVATSNTSSLGEISKDNAVVFDPTDVADITKAIKKMTSSPALLKQLSIKGKQHAARFTWREYYESMIETLT